jgi:hypothetical protein
VIGAEIGGFQQLKGRLPQQQVVGIELCHGTYIRAESAVFENLEADVPVPRAALCA